MRLCGIVQFVLASRGAFEVPCVRAPARPGVGQEAAGLPVRTSPEADASGDNAPRSRPLRWCERHLARCPACQAALRDTAHLVSRLEVGAGARREAAPPFLAGRIVAAVAAASAPARATASQIWVRLIWSAGTCAVALALGLALWLPKPNSQRASKVVAAAGTGGSSVALVASLPIRLLDREELRTYRENVALDLEWERVLADARSAARSLAAAFVPERPIEF